MKNFQVYFVLFSSGYIYEDKYNKFNKKRKIIGLLLNKKNL